MIIVELKEKIPFLNLQLTKFAWTLEYPSNNATFYLLDEKNNRYLGKIIQVPNEVVQKWGEDDSIISNYLIEGKFWEFEYSTTNPDSNETPTTKY